MKILHLSHLSPVSYDKFYGRAIHNLIKEMVRKGLTVKVVSPIPWTPFAAKYLTPKWRKYSRIPHKMIQEGIEVYHPRYVEFPRAMFFANSGERMYRGIHRIVEQIYENFQFDLIHAHTALPDGYAAMLLKEKYKKPLVLTLRSSDLNISIFKSKKIFEIIRKVASKAEVVLTPSPYLQKKAQEHLKIKPIIIPNGIDLNDVFKGTSELSKRYENKKIVLSTSRLIKIKGLDFNLRAIAKLEEKYSNLLYLIIGNGPEKRNLENLVKDLNLEKNVEFLGWQPHEKTMEYISICNIFSMPSWRETFGLVYLEAMAHSKPIIGCHGQGIDGIVTEKETGILVKPKDIDSLTVAIDFLLSNPDRAKKIGERAKKLVLENYTWEKVVAQLIQLYKSLTT